MRFLFPRQRGGRTDFVPAAEDERRAEPTEGLAVRYGETDRLKGAFFRMSRACLALSVLTLGDVYRLRGRKLREFRL
jgi:hypothetical protein